jgi:soluble lytic murein transglycosylase-like protein
MTIRLLKKTAFLGLGLLFACANPFVSVPEASADYRQAQKIATLISEEVPTSRAYATSIDLFDLSRHIIRLSRDYEIDPLLVLAIIKVESGFKPEARSYVGAIGLMQVMPIVIREVGRDVQVHHRDDLYDPYKNVRLGIHYFTYLRDKYKNDLRNALVAYNLGPSALDSRLRRQDSVPTSYYRKVMKCYDAFREKMVTRVAFLSVT